MITFLLESTWKSQSARILGQLPAQYLAWMCLPQGMCSSLSVESHLKVLPAHIAPACAFVTNCTFLTNCSVWSPQVDAFGVLSPRGMHSPGSIYFTENKEGDRFSISQKPYNSNAESPRGSDYLLLHRYPIIFSFILHTWAILRESIKDQGCWNWREKTRK